MGEGEPAARGAEGGRAVPYARCFSGLEAALEGKPLRELDPETVKNEIKKWARAVVAYAARQLSKSFSGRREKNSEA